MLELKKRRKIQIILIVKESCSLAVVGGDVVEVVALVVIGVVVVITIPVVVN